MMIAALILLLAQQTPEEILGKIQETIDKAKTIEAEYAVEVAGAKISGTLQIKNGNKVRVTTSVNANNETHEKEIVSDGAKLYRFSDGAAGSPKEPSKNLELQMRALLGTMSFTIVEIEPPDTMKLDQLYKVSDLKAGADDGGLKTLEYTWTLKALPDTAPAKARLWVDPKTWLVSKRTLTVTMDGQTAVITEKFSKVVLNGDIPDATFQFVVDKKK